jgi:hypothetical protein
METATLDMDRICECIIADTRKWAVLQLAGEAEG